MTRPTSFTRDPGDVQRLRASGEWADDTLGDRLRHLAVTRPGHLALADSREQLTFLEYWQEVAGLAESLLEMGIKPGDRLGIVLPNRVDFPITRLAAAEVGAVSVLLNSSWSPQQVVSALQQSGCVGVVAADRRGDGALGAALGDLVGRNDVLRWFAMNDASDEATDFARMRKRSAVFPDGPRFEGAVSSPFVVDDVIFTSGTTGAPKGVMSCQARWIAGSERQRRAGGLDTDDIGAVIGPVGGATGYLKSVVLGLATGGTIVLIEDPDPPKVLNTIERMGVTWLASLPALTARLVRFIESARQDSDGLDISSLRLVFNGGAPMPETLANDLHRLLDVFVMTAIGSTEAGSPAGTRLEDSREVQSTTVGRAFDGAQMAVLADGKVHSTGVGELLSRGAMAFDGYLDEPAATAELFVDGWIRHKDRVEIGSDGNIEFLGRMDDVINRGGTKVSPLEVERHCLGHPSVETCAAFAVDDADLGSRVGLAVVLRNGTNLDVQALRSFLIGRSVPRSEQPESLSFFDVLPMGPSGKVDRKRISHEWSLAVEASLRSAIC